MYMWNLKRIELTELIETKQIGGRQKGRVEGEGGRLEGRWSKDTNFQV